MPPAVPPSNQFQSAPLREQGRNLQVVIGRVSVLAVSIRSPARAREKRRFCRRLRELIKGFNPLPCASKGETVDAVAALLARLQFQSAPLREQGRNMLSPLR